MEFKYASTPEIGGIPSHAVKAFLSKVKTKKMNLHSMMMLRGETILAEAHYAPYQKDSMHRIYSITKTVTSLAIGLLLDEGKIQLTDEICGYFPEKLPEVVDPRIQKTTIEDMLRMATAHQSTTYKRYDGDWVESFFCVEPTHEPGCVFHYDTSAVHVLGALVEKLTGKKLLTFLREKCFDKLGISEEAYILEDPYGVSEAGSGMMCTTEDLAKLAYLCTHYGYVDGEQIYPEWYLRKATAKQISTRLKPLEDEQYGYGYYIWQSRENKGFCMYGMGGQLAICFPEYDFIMITTGDMQGVGSGLQTLYDAFYDTIFPYVEGKRVVEPLEFDMEAMSLFDNVRLEGLNEERKTSKIYQMMCQDQLNLICQENPQGITSVQIQVNQEIETGTFTYERQAKIYTLPFSFKEYVRYRLFEEGKVEAITMAAMENEHHLLLRTYLLGERLANFWIEIGFSNDEKRATIKMQKAADQFLKEYEGVIGCEIVTI